MTRTTRNLLLVGTALGGLLLFLWWLFSSTLDDRPPIRVRNGSVEVWTSGGEFVNEGAEWRQTRQGPGQPTVMDVGIYGTLSGTSHQSCKNLRNAGDVSILYGSTAEEFSITITLRRRYPLGARHVYLDNVADMNFDPPGLLTIKGDGYHLIGVTAGNRRCMFSDITDKTNCIVLLPRAQSDELPSQCIE